MDIKGKKILVTGGAGFIGSHTVDALIEKGANVVVADNLSTGSKENINSKAKFYNINIADKNIKGIFETEKPEIVYHFAFNVLVPKSVEDPLIDMDSIIGSVNILSNCRQYGIEKIIFSSSGFVYGNPKKFPSKETEDVDPVSSYVVAKQAVENYLKFFNKAFNIPYVIFRYSTVYGPGQVKGAMSDYIKKLVSGMQAEFWGDGRKTRDYVYVSDVVRASILVLDLPANYPDPVFNVGTGRETTLNDLYKKIAALLNKPVKPIYLPDRPGEIKRFCLDCSKIRKDLGWSPQVSLEEGLKLTLKSKNLL